MANSTCVESKPKNVEYSRTKENPFPTCVGRFRVLVAANSIRLNPSILRFLSIQVKLRLAHEPCLVCCHRNCKSEEFTLANTSAAQKEIRKNARRRQRNRLVKAKTRTVSKKATQAIAAGDKNAAALVRDAQIELDAAAQKGIIHKNAAARKKSRLARRLNAAQAKK